MNKAKEIRNKTRKQYMWGSTSGWTCLQYRLAKSESYYKYRFLMHLKIYEYLITQKTTPLTYIRRRYHLNKYTKYARKCDFAINDGVLGENILFYHTAKIVINPAAKVGDGCRFHGPCCIGVAHTGDTKAPILGKNIDIGFGAVILGDIYIADNITIGANAVVTKSFYTPGITIAGVPAREIKKSETNN